MPMRATVVAARRLHVSQICTSSLAVPSPSVALSNIDSAQALPPMALLPLTGLRTMIGRALLWLALELWLLA